MKKAIFWFRRDLRWDDNHGLFEALNQAEEVYPVFIFDHQILKNLAKNDHRVSFIHHSLKNLSKQKKIALHYGDPKEIIPQLAEELQVDAVFCNMDFENYAVQRDTYVAEQLKTKNIAFHHFLDHLIHHPGAILKNDQSGPVKVYTPYAKKWKKLLAEEGLKHYPSEKRLEHLKTSAGSVENLEDFGFSPTELCFPELDLNEATLQAYPETRNLLDPEFKTSKAGTFLRFGNVSIRKLVARAQLLSDPQYLNELIWRSFFIMLYYHYPRIEHEPLKAEFKDWEWTDPAQASYYEKWCTGNTGFPIIDAAMRELITTGHMHNRMRMVVASFLTKLLNIDWQLGAAHFATWLFDFEAAVNLGNWQWVSGTGSDAVPYFRIYNPHSQQEKFDANQAYLRKHLPTSYWENPPAPMIDYKQAREEYLEMAKTFRAKLKEA